MNTYTYYLLDVFTDIKLSGNQLAVLPDAHGIEEQLLQKIAREFNLSETVFLYPSKNASHPKMRIFTPYQELPTAGHPTIGTAFILGMESKKDEIILSQKIGEVKVGVSYKNHAPDIITMKQNLPDFGPIHNNIRKDIAKTLSLKENDLDKYPIQEVSCGNNFLFVPIKDAKKLSEINFKNEIREGIGEITHQASFYCFSINNVVEGNIQGRMFAPQWGIHEDPATGSANGPLASYLVHHHILQMPAISLQGYEMGRPSQLYLDVTVGPNNEIKEVKVGGKCKLVGKGELFLGS